MSEIIRKLNDRNVIKISHELNYARYNIGIIAMDIIYMLIAQIKREDIEFNEFNISVIELEKRLGRKLNRTSLKVASEELINESIIFTKLTNISHPWVNYFELDSKMGLIRIQLHTHLKKHLLNPNLYAIGNLNSIIALKSHYAKRLYMLFCQFGTMKKFTIGVKPIRTMLSTPESLTNVYANLKERVIEPCLFNINQLPDIKVKYSEIKTGRSITDFEFVVIKKVIEPKIKIYKKGVVSTQNWLEKKQAQEIAIDVEVA